MSPRKPTPEGRVQRAIIEYLTACRLGKVRRVNAGVAKVGNAPTHPWAKDTRYRIQLAEPGHSDLVVELDGDARNIYIEVKAPGGKATELQLAFLNRQRTRGNWGFVASSVCEVYAELTRLGFQGLPAPASGRPQETRKTPGRREGSGGIS